MMSKLIPSNLYWPGRIRNGMFVLLAISVIVFLYTVVTVAAFGYSVKHPSRYSDGRRLPVEDRWNGTSGIQWDESPGASAAEVFIRAAPIFVDLFHIPISVFLYRRGGHHPVAALTMSLLVLGGWINLSFWRSFYDFVVPEVTLSKTWLGLSYACTAFAGLISILYFVYMGYCAAAVHVWRREKKDRKRMRGASWKVDGAADADADAVEMGRKV